MPKIGSFIRAIPWPVWGGILCATAWLGRKWLLIAATVLAFHPVPIPPLFQGKPQSVREAQIQDLQHFEHVRRNERSWTNATRAEFDSEVESLRSRAGTLSEAGFMLGLARAQATIDNGHSNASLTSMVRRFPHLPIRTAFFGSELRVMRATAEHQDLLGARITHMNGQDIETVTHRFRDAMGGTDASFLKVVPLLLETPTYLAEIGLSGSSVTIRFEKEGAAPFERKLSPSDVSDIKKWSIPGDLPLPWKQDSSTLTALRPSSTPLYLQHPSRGYWSVDVPEMNAVYINLRANLDDGTGQSLRQFSESTRKALLSRAKPPRMVIVDLRFNHGGDYSLTHDLMVSLGKSVGRDGRVYFLTSGNTFSAAIVSLAFAKQAAPDKVVLVGEPIGDRLQFWAEGWRYTLPNSGFGARYATAYYDLQKGCEGIFRCYWGAFYLFPVTVDDLDIDLSAPLTFESYVAGRDPAFEAIRAMEEVNRP